MSKSLVQGAWKLLSSELLLHDAINRSSHSVNFLANKLFIFGGEHEPRKPIDNKILKIDLETKKFEYVEGKSGDKHVPCPRVAHSASFINEKLYIFGGRVGIGMDEGALNDLYEFNTATNEWKLLDDGVSKANDQRPAARSYHAMTSLDEKLYIFGGCTESRLNDFFSYDTVKAEWKKLAQDELIKPRGGSAICSYKNEATNEACIYLFGGFCGHELSDCFKYSIEENSWSQISGLPSGLSVFASASLNQPNARIIVHGGEIDPSTQGHTAAGEFTADTILFDGEAWSKVKIENEEVMPSSRGWHAGSSGSGKFFVYGGNLENNARTNELWQLELQF